MIKTYWLDSGMHEQREDGLCAMEWVSFLAGEEHSDKPVCVSPLLTSFCVSLNDALPDDQRQRLRPYLARTIGTRGDGLDDERSWMCADWLIRTYTPTWLDLIPSLQADAEVLRSLPPVLAVDNVQRAMADLNHAQGNASAAESAAGSAAWSAARSTAWSAAWSTARSAGWSAARSAAESAAWSALTPTVIRLQDSVLSPGGLLDQMLPTELISMPAVSEWREVCGLELATA